MNDSTKQRGCVADGCCPSTQQWREQRFIWVAKTGAGVLVQPSVGTLLATVRPDGEDPGMAVVSLHSIASVRERSAISDTPPIGVIRTASQPIPIASALNAAIDQPVNAFNTGRGVALPQYRLTFKDGSTDAAVVYADGGSILSHPASEVKVEAITPPLEYNGVGDPPATLPAGVLVDAVAAASVAWGEKEGAAGPVGMATFSQAIVAVSGSDVFFERPPFARRVVFIPPLGTTASWEFMSSPTQRIAAPPAAANTVQQPQDVPAAATHIRVKLLPVVPANTLVNAVWEIGVR